MKKPTKVEVRAKNLPLFSLLLAPWIAWPDSLSGSYFEFSIEKPFCEVY
jgi:hypothetical protein